MPLNPFITATLEDLGMHPQPTGDPWFGVWTAILCHFFPSSDGYLVCPEQRISTKEPFILKVTKVALAPLTTRIVLVFAMAAAQHWPDGKDALSQLLWRQTQTAFSATAIEAVYWIGAIESHWRHGKTAVEGSSDMPSASEWHDTIHGEDSLESLARLARLVRDM
jgi:hypothetical protein